MMMNLFSVFDPTSYCGLSLNWMIMLVVMFSIPSKYYLTDGGGLIMLKSVFMGVSKVFHEVCFPNYIGLIFFFV